MLTSPRSLRHFLRGSLLRSGALFLAAVASLPGGAGAQGEGPFIQQEPRAMARVVYFSQAGLAGEYAIEYGKPAWRSDYDAAFEKLTRGQRMRLGRDWWTTLNTFCALKLGEKGELKPGEYFLALECSDKGDWSLIALDPEPLRKSKIDAFGTAQTKGGTKIPLSYATTDDAVKELSIAFVADPASTKQQTLEIRFGKHRLTTTVKPTL